MNLKIIGKLSTTFIKISTTRYFSTTTLSTLRSPSSPSTSQPIKNFNKILILTKLTRLEYEKLCFPNLTNVELETLLKKRGSNYNMLLYHHYIHKGTESRILNYLKEYGVQTRIVNRLEYNQELINWSDLIITTGGDGTFLMGASRILNKYKPIIGFNTDPTRSEGYLCLPKKYSINIQDGINKILNGSFHWIFRNRIRICLIGDESIYSNPIELHDQELKYLHVYNNNYEEEEEDDRRGSGRELNEQQQQHTTHDNITKQKTYPLKRILPVLSLNEIYLGECISARASYFEISIDGHEKIKTKNAGLCISTGTGSTSWSYNINKISYQSMDIIYNILQEMDIIKEESKLTNNNNNNNHNNNNNNKDILNNIIKIYNNKLIYKYNNNHMMYTIRDPISTYSLPYAIELEPRGIIKDKIEIRSRCFDGVLVIDGGLSFKFNDGTVVLLEMNECDSLLTTIDLF